MEKFLIEAAALSKKDTAKSVLKISDLALKLGFGFAPGASAIYELTKISLEAARDWMQIRNENRILDFHRTLLYKDQVIDQKMMDAELNTADFHALLDACVSDIEEEKTTPYANLTRSIALGLVPVAYRRHFIHSLKDLAFEHLDVLREAYALTRYTCIVKTKIINPENFLNGLRANSITQLALKTLIARGMINETKITALGVKFIESCYSMEDLAPQNFDYTTSRQERGVIIKLGDNKEITEIEKALIRELQNRQIQAETSDAVKFDGSLFDDPYVIFATYAFVIGFQNSVYSQGLSDTLNDSLLGKKSMQIFSGDMLLPDKEPVSFMDAPSKIMRADRIAQSAFEAVESILRTK